MAKTKAQLKDEQSRFHAHEVAASKSFQAGEFAAGLEACADSLEFIDGMMQYAQRYEKQDFRSVNTIDAILKYGPPLLQRPILERLQETLEDQRRIDRVATDDLASALGEAWARFKECYCVLDNLLEHKHRTRVAVANADSPDAQWAVDRLLEVGIVERRADDSLQLRFDPDREVGGKCSVCGAIQTGAKRLFWLPKTCLSCLTECDFVLAIDHVPTGE